MPSRPKAAYDPFKFSETRERQLIQYGIIAQQSLYTQMQFREMLQYVDKAYQRELDYTEEQIKARRANRQGDPTKFQDVTVPIVMSQVEAALAYFTNVFLTGYPIFGVAGGVEVADAALMLETIVGENSITGRWIPNLMMFFRDTLKYNLGALEVEWTTKNMSATVSDLTMPNNAGSKQVLWHGNTIKRLDLYNTFFDTRVAPTEMHTKGEFVGYNELLSRTALVQLMMDLGVPYAGDMTAEVFNTSYPGGQISGSASTPYNYYVPLINPIPFMDTANLYTTNWMAWAGMEQSAGRNAATPAGSGMYCRTRMYNLTLADTTYPHTAAFL